MQKKQKFHNPSAAAVEHRLTKGLPMGPFQTQMTDKRPPPARPAREVLNRWWGRGLAAE
jgi:hypothetical protein